MKNRTSTSLSVSPQSLSLSKSLHSSVWDSPPLFHFVLRRRSPAFLSPPWLSLSVSVSQSLRVTERATEPAVLVLLAGWFIYLFICLVVLFGEVRIATRSVFYEPQQKIIFSNQNNIIISTYFLLNRWFPVTISMKILPGTVQIQPWVATSPVIAKENSLPKHENIAFFSEKKMKK